MTRQEADVGASGSPSGATTETDRPNRPVTAGSSAPTNAPLSMLRGLRLPLDVAAIGPSASHAPMRPSADGTMATSAPANAARGHTANQAAAKRTNETQRHPS